MELKVVPQVACGKSGSDIAQGSNVVWSMLTNNDLHSYELLMEELLDSIHVPSEILHGDKYCSHNSHFLLIEQYFRSVLEVLVICDAQLPRKSTFGKKGKGFWSDSLTKLKNDSFKALPTEVEVVDPPAALYSTGKSPVITCTRQNSGANEECTPLRKVTI